MEEEELAMKDPRTADVLLQIQMAWQRAEDLGLPDPDDTRREALGLFILTGGHIRDFLEDNRYRPRGGRFFRSAGDAA